MSHMIEQVDGKWAMAFTGPRSQVWHGLGTQIDDNATPTELLKAASLDWGVEMIPATAMFKGDQIGTGHSALVRDLDGRVLDVVPSTWNAVQNSEMAEFFEASVRAGDMKMDTAGSLKDGTLVWMLAKVGTDFTIFGGDKVESYLLFSNPHLFGKAIDVRFTATRVVCNNTITQALAGKAKNSVKQSHRTPFDIAKIQDVLGMVAARMEAYKLNAELLGAKKYRDEDVITYFQRIFPVLTQKDDSKKELSKMGQLAASILETQPGAEYAPKSLWNLFNAATYITNHEYGKTDDGRVNNLLFGPNAGVNQRAMDFALELAA